jgi:hypothetical protein
MMEKNARKSRFHLTSAAKLARLASAHTVR